MTNNRIIEFEKVENFRDIGGLKTIDGTIVNTGIVYRSDDISGMSKSDLEKFRRLNIKTIFDLRTQNERKSKIIKFSSSDTIQIINIPLYYNAKVTNNLQFMKFLIIQKEQIDFKKFLKEMYHSIAFESISQVRQIMTLLSNKKNIPALIHCTTGKDRTGCISALIQLLTGVAQETVLEDYLVTNEYVKKRIKKMVRFVRWISLFRVSLKELEDLFVARDDYMKGYMNDILKIYSTIENYLSKACGIEEQDILKLKQLLLHYHPKGK